MNHNRTNSKRRYILLFYINYNRNQNSLNQIIWTNIQ